MIEKCDKCPYKYSQAPCEFANDINSYYKPIPHDCPMRGKKLEWPAVINISKKSKTHSTEGQVVDSQIEIKKLKKITKLGETIKIV